jgi:hypothetical protein
MRSRPSMPILNFQPREKRDCEPFFEAFSTTWLVNCRRSLGRSSAKRLQRTRERPPHYNPAQERGPTDQSGKAGARSPQPEPRSFVFLLLPGIATPSFSEASKALWDANSTPVCWGCQEGIPIYCISVLASRMLVLAAGFSTERRLFAARSGKVRGHDEAVPAGFALFEFFRGLRGRGTKFSQGLTPASRLGTSSGASDLKEKNFAGSAGATAQRRDPWLRIHPQKFHGGRSFAFRLRTPQDSRLFVRDVHVRAHPGTPGDR